MIYRVTTSKWEYGEEIHITWPGGDGVTQTHVDHPATVEEMVRDYLATVEREDAYTAELVIESR